MNIRNRRKWWGGASMLAFAAVAVIVGRMVDAAASGSDGASGAWCGIMSGMSSAGSTVAQAATQPKTATRAAALATAGSGLTPAQLAKTHLATTRLMNEQGLTPTILPDGTKQFTLTASAFQWPLWPGERVEAWGFNGQATGPLIRVRVGDKVAIVVHNHLPDFTTVHWDGLSVPNAMDGVPDVTQAPIAPGSTFVYRFTVTPDMVGTHYYRSGYNPVFQDDKGMYGPIIVDPLHPTTHTDIDVLYVLGAWSVNGADEAENAFTMNGQAAPYTPQLNVKLGQTVRIRLINASAICAHAMHLHGYTFHVVAIDGNPVAHPPAQNTVTLQPGQTADIEFTANLIGHWMFHCHILDHTMNPGDMADEMGGLVTYVNVHR